MARDISVHATKKSLDPEYVAMSDFLSTIDHSSIQEGEQDVLEPQLSNDDDRLDRKRNSRTLIGSYPYCKYNTAMEEESDKDRQYAIGYTYKKKNMKSSEELELCGLSRKSAKGMRTVLRGTDDRAGTMEKKEDSSCKASASFASARNARLTELEQYVRKLGSENLRLKQTLSLGNNAAHLLASRSQSKERMHQLFEARTGLVENMVDRMNAVCLNAEDARKWWHPCCRIGIGVCEGDAIGRHEIVQLWNLIRSLFANMVVDIVDLRPHLPDGEMILTKWRIQGEIADSAQLEALYASQSCPQFMRVVLQAITSTDLTFTVTVYMVFDELLVIEQHHCWDQVGVLRRLFGGNLPPSVVDYLSIP